MPTILNMEITLFTETERPLFSGSAEEIAEFGISAHLMHIDWRASEEDVIQEAAQFLPQGALRYEITVAVENHSQRIEMHYRDRKESITLEFDSTSKYIVLMYLARLLQPDCEIRLFLNSWGSDTTSYMLRPAAWWKAYRTLYPVRYVELFGDVSVVLEWEGMDKDWEKSALPPTEAAASHVPSQVAPSQPLTTPTRLEPTPKTSTANHLAWGASAGTGAPHAWGTQTLPDIQAVGGDQPATRVRTQGLQILLGAGALTVIIIFLAAYLKVPHGMLWGFGIGVPSAIALTGLLQLITGVPFAQIATQWDQLKGWQRGVLGVIVVALAFVLMMGGIMLFA